MRAIGYIDYDPAAEGISQLSLTRLRDVLVEKFNIPIVVIKIPTDEGIFGYLVISKALRYACWTGDGFREDGRGEGGRATNSSYALLTIFHRDILTYHEAVNLSEGQVLIANGEVHKGKVVLLQQFQKVFDEIVVEGDFCMCAGTKAGYIR